MWVPGSCSADAWLTCAVGWLFPCVAAPESPCNILHRFSIVASAEPCPVQNWRRKDCRTKPTSLHQEERHEPRDVLRLNDMSRVYKNEFATAWSFYLRQLTRKVLNPGSRNYSDPECLSFSPPWHPDHRFLFVVACSHAQPHSGTLQMLQKKDNTTHTVNKTTSTNYIFTDSPPSDSPMELQRSMGLEEWCREGNRESGRQHLSFTNRAFLGGQVKYRVPLKVPSVQPGHSSSWEKVQMN